MPAGGGASAREGATRKRRRKSVTVWRIIRPPEAAPVCDVPRRETYLTQSSLDKGLFGVLRGEVLSIRAL